MKTLFPLLTSCFVVALAVSGCVEPAAPSRVAGSSNLPAVAEGTIASPIAVEEGFLRMDLTDGTRMEFMTDESVASMDSLLTSAGKKCRVYYKNSFYEDVEGNRSPALQMTKIELL